MIKQITLTKNSLARLEDKEPFLMPDFLELEFKSIGYDLTNAFIVLKNGEKQGKFRLEKVFRIPDEFLFAGVLNMSIYAYINGELLKQWNVLPIKFIETENDVQGFDYFGEIERQISEIKNDYIGKEEHKRVIEKINEVVDNQNKLIETVSEIKENYVAEAKNIL